MNQENSGKSRATVQSIKNGIALIGNELFTNLQFKKINEGFIITDGINEFFRVDEKFIVIGITFINITKKIATNIQELTGKSEAFIENTMHLLQVDFINELRQVSGKIIDTNLICKSLKKHTECIIKGTEDQVAA